MMVINNVFEIGDSVYLKTDTGQNKRIVTSIKVYKAGELTYTVACGRDYSEHYEFEMSTDIDFTLKNE